MANYEKYTGSQGEQEQVRMIYRSNLVLELLSRSLDILVLDDQYQHVIIAYYKMANYEKYTGSQGEQEQVRMIYRSI